MTQLTTDQMAPETLEALKGSIAKWEAIVSGTGIDKGFVNCPLCHRFADRANESTSECAGCPVAKATGEPACRGSPYERWSELTSESWNRTAKTDEEREAAQAELDFLKSLLPKEAA